MRLLRPLVYGTSSLISFITLLTGTVRGESAVLWLFVVGVVCGITALCQFLVTALPLTEKQRRKVIYAGFYVAGLPCVLIGIVALITSVFTALL